MMSYERAMVGLLIEGELIQGEPWEGSPAPSGLAAFGLPCSRILLKGNPSWIPPPPPDLLASGGHHSRSLVTSRARGYHCSGSGQGGEDMRFGIFTSMGMQTWSGVLELWRHLERTGWDIACVTDHFLPNTKDREGAMLES